MTIDRAVFDRVKRKWGRYPSWAVWAAVAPTDPPKANIGDLRVLDLADNPGLLDVLNPDVITIGLNASSRDVSGEDWFGFHDPSPRANYFKLRFAFRDTFLWGACMTDVFNDLHETRSNLVADFLKANPAEIQRGIDRIAGEIADLGCADPLLVVFGGAAHSYVAVHFGSTHRVVKVPHFSTYVSKSPTGNRSSTP